MTHRGFELSTPAPTTRLRRNAKRAFAAVAAASLGVVGLAPAAMAQPTEDDLSGALAELIDLDALGIDAVEAIRVGSGFPDEPEPDPATVDAEVLNGLIAADIGAIGLPLIGDGDNDGLLHLGPLAEAGLLNGFAESPDALNSTAASGAVGADGAINLDADSDPSHINAARVDLTGLLGQLDVDGLTDAIVDEVSLALGALASRASADGEDLDSEYLLTGAELRISSPAVGSLTQALATAYVSSTSDVENAVAALVGEGGAIDNALGDLASIHRSVESVERRGIRRMPF